MWRYSATFETKKEVYTFYAYIPFIDLSLIYYSRYVCLQ